MRILKILALLLIAVAGISFAWLNAQAVPFHYYLGSSEFRLAWLLVLFLFTGWVGGVLTMLRSVISLRHRLLRANRKLKLSEREIGNLRSLPIRDAD